MSASDAAAAPPRSNSHARFARRTAEALGYAFRSLDGADAYLFEVRDGARSAVFACGAATPYALNPAHAYGLARDKAFAAQVLAQAGLPTIPSRLFFATTRHAAFRAPGREPADARVFAQSAAYPVFCKPNAGSRGALAEIVGDAAQFEDYLARVAQAHDAFLVQPYLRGREHRVFVLHDRALFSYEKSKPFLIGDGRSSLAHLRAALLQRASGAAPSPPESLRYVDPEGRALAPSDRPAAGVRVLVEGPANRAAGGDAVRVIDGASPALAQLALAAARALDLRLCALDVFDLSAAGDLSALCVIEANASPAIETLEAHDRFDLIETIWAANFAAALR